MALHRIKTVTIGVPDVAATAAYYADFGLLPMAGPAGAAGSAGEARFATVDGGEQLRLVHSPRRRLARLALEADGEDDIARIAESLHQQDDPFTCTAAGLETREPAANIAVGVSAGPRPVQVPAPGGPVNRPGDMRQVDARADALRRTGLVRPRRLGHVVIGSTDRDATRDFFTDGLGFKVDEVPGLACFMRCSEEHHNVLVQAAPVDFLHHTAWQVDDVDEVGPGDRHAGQGCPPACVGPRPSLPGLEFLLVPSGSRW